MADFVHLPPGASDEIWPNDPIEVETRKNVYLHETENGVRYSLRRSKAFRFYTLFYRQRSLAEFQLIVPFWASNYPRQAVLWTNPDAFVDNDSFYIDAPLKYQPDAHDSISYYLTLRAVAALATPTTPFDNVMPYDPDFGYESEDSKAVNLSDALSFIRAVAPLGDRRRSFDLKFTNRTYWETVLMEEFWNYHYPGKPVEMQAAFEVLGVGGEFLINSNFKWTIHDYDRIDWDFNVIQYVAATSYPAASGSLSPSASVSRSISPSASRSPSASLSPSHSRSPSSSVSPSASISPSASVSPSSSPSSSPSASLSPSSSPSASSSPSPSLSPSGSISPSSSPSSSPSASESPSASISPSASVSPSGSTSPSASGSPSASLSPSASRSPSSSSSPSPDASLLLDLEADAGLGLSDNDPVAFWENQNGSGNDATQPGASKPTFKATAGPGSRPTVRFGGSMTLDSAIGLGAACTIFCVLKPTDSGTRTIIGGSIGCVQFRLNGGKQNLVKQELVDIASSSTNLSTSAFQQINMTWDGTTATFRLGGAADGNTSNAQTITVASGDIGTAASQPFDGDICMLKIYNRVLSGAEIAAEEAAILSRWGV